MTLIASKTAYEDCYDILDRALASPAGIRTSCMGKGPAHHLNGRLQFARMLSRRESRDIHEPGQPGYDTSAYDTLIIRQPREEDGVWWIYIEPRKVTGEIEELAAS